MRINNFSAINLFYKKWEGCGMLPTVKIFLEKF
jgi:hypothetical protein